MAETKRIRTLPVVELLDELNVRGARLERNVADALLTATVESSVDMIAEVELTFHDPKFRLLQSELMAKGGTVDMANLRLVISVVETSSGDDGRGQLTVRARSEVIQKLRKRRGVKIMRKASPSDFVIEECKKIGAKYVVQPSSKRRQVHRDTKKSAQASTGTERPSSWTTFQRLATEIGYVVFEAAGTIYFGQPSWFAKRDKSAPALVTYNTGEASDCIGVPRIRDTDDPTDEQDFSVDLDLPRSRIKEFMPGQRLFFDFPPYRNRTLLISALRYDIVGDGFLSITAGEPIDPKPQPAPKRNPRSRADAPSNKDGNGTSPSGRRSALDFATIALSQSGDAYVYGAEASAGDLNPDAFDCSELVEWAAARTGCFMVDGSANQRAYCASKGTLIPVEQAIRTRGALLFGAAPGSTTVTHVAISLGNGTSIEAVNREYGVRVMSATSRSSVHWVAAGKVPGMAY